MRFELRCEDVGFDCRHILRGETEDEVVEALMRHIDAEHDSDWFDVEEIYVNARDRVHLGAA